jgi:hypothetical protein
MVVPFILTVCNIPEDQLDRYYEELKMESGRKRISDKRRKANWIGHVLPMNYLLRHVLQEDKRSKEVI